MKALSLKQPWANLIVHGIKTIETRKWATKYRGSLLICSSKNYDKDFRFITSLINPYISNSPFGMALCMVEITDCLPMQKQDEKAACCHVYPHAFSFFLRNICPIKPFPVKGQLGIFDIEPEEIIYL